MRCTAYPVPVTRSKGHVRPVPPTPAAWLEEVALAYQDALDMLPLARPGDPRPQSTDLVGLAPVLALQIRGLERTSGRLKRATDAALSSYVASVGSAPELASHGPIAFAFGYLASHFGLDLVSEEELDAVMEFLVTNEPLLRDRISQPPPSRKGRRAPRS